MLPDTLRANLRRYHEEFFQRYPDLSSSSTVDEHRSNGKTNDSLVSRTLRFYSFLHPRLVTDITPELREYWSSSFALRIQAEPATFARKVGLDAGCGEGRYSWHVANQGAEVIGIDLSEGVNVAFRNTSNLDRVHIVQASLYNLPIRPGSLDFVFSTGVLHHLPEPGKGFEHLVPVLKPGGRMMIWVYGLAQMNMTYQLSHLTSLRGIGSRLEPEVCFALSAALAVALEGSIYTPARVLAATGFEDRLPKQLLEVARLPFIWKVKEAQDRIGVPVTYYLTHDELVEWFHTASFEDVKIVNSSGRGWYGSGIRI
ncbi:MAG: class I SAM-dependent methyltransferase [Chloroflexota bacterium]|nr:class I SAM-dependent methyltransferase [Chloroflexota bacterium]